jgi:asparagine synthase (glutamine-hydrolysing)
MCGIAGEWDWGDVPRAQSALAAMIDSLVHRGPEGRTCWLSPDRTLALGYAQLSFFKGAKAQPISNRRNTIFAVCNGEIYNYRELAGLARQPELRSDIEVIPYLYELRGPSSFALLQGEFAFALYDCENQSLYLVRDGFGIKPLYYHTTVSSVVFASEIKALFANPRVPRKLDNASLATKLCGITLPGNTAFSTIREVKPGSYVEFKANRISEQPYWSPKLEACGCPQDADELAHNFLDLFDAAVRVRLHGDYPVGAYLSSGIDSSAVLASMVNAGARSLKAFTISFEDRLFDESSAAANTASRLGVEHHIVRVRNRDIVENFLHSIWHSEIPVINCHGTAKFLLSRAASAHVKAIMTGEGADELFAGYPYFGANGGTEKQLGIRRQFVNWWHLLGSGQLISGLLPLPREKDLNRLRALFGCTPYLGQRALFYGRFIRAHLNHDFLRYFSPLGALELLGQDLRSAVVSPMTPMNADRFLALRYDLPAYILNFLADRQEMAHSIEGRLPFLDKNVVAFACALRDEALIGNAAGKKIIRTAFAQRLPPEALKSPKKIFLAPPGVVDDVLRSEWAHHLLSRAVTDAVGIFDWKKLTLLRAGLKVAPPHVGAGVAMRSFLIFIISLHALHDLFVVGRRPKLAHPPTCKAIGGAPRSNC